MRRAHYGRDLIVGVVYLVVIASVVAVCILFYNKTFTSTTDVTLEVSTAGTALAEGADVEVRGVVVGSVGTISSTGQGASIQLKLQPGEAGRLPTNVTAALLPKTLFGQRYVSLSIPAAPSASHLADGDVISSPDGRPAELEDVFSHLLPVLQAVQPDKLAATLGAIAATLRHQGTDIAATIDTLSRYLRKFAPDVPKLVADIDDFGKVAKTYAKASPDLLQALRNFTVTNRTLVAQRVQFANLLTNVTNASDRITRFTSANATNLINLARSSEPTLRVLARYSPEFPCLARSLEQFIPTMNSALGAGTAQPGLHVTLRVVPARSPYTTGPGGYTADSGPSCPETSTSTAGTALGALDTTLSSADTANSPQENEVIAEMMAASDGTSPASFPKWGSLMLGPTLRGTTVTMR